jgi:hypothetical protein
MEDAMAKLTSAATVIAGIMVFSTSAMADSVKGDPIYIGDRSTNAEQETFGYTAGTTESPHLLAFIGPARNVGRVTGDPEKDTIAYRPLLGTLIYDSWSFCLERE